MTRALQVMRQSVHDWVSRHRRRSEPAALVDTPKSGRPCKADEATETLLQALMMFRQSAAVIMRRIGLYRYYKIRCVRTWAYSAAK